MTEQEKTKADAAAYAVEIELLTWALLNLTSIKDSPPSYYALEEQEIERRLMVLLDLEEIT